MAQIIGINDMYYSSAAFSGRSTGSIGTASELATPKKRNQILALENPILLVPIHEDSHIIYIHQLQYAKYRAEPGVGQGGPSMHPRHGIDG